MFQACIIQKYKIFKVFQVWLEYLQQSNMPKLNLIFWKIMYFCDFECMGMIFGACLQYDILEKHVYFDFYCRILITDILPFGAKYFHAT